MSCEWVLVLRVEMRIRRRWRVGVVSAFMVVDVGGGEGEQAVNGLVSEQVPSFSSSTSPFTPRGPRSFLLLTFPKSSAGAEEDGSSDRVLLHVLY